MMRRVSILIACVLGAWACEPPSAPTNQVYPPVPLDDQTLVMEVAATVVAVDRISGQRRWSYSVGIADERGEVTGRFPLSCPPAPAPNQTLFLAFPGQLHNVTSAGELRWRAPITRLSSLQCPVVTPDSGVLMLGRNLRTLVKHDAKGDVEFRFDFRFAGMASRPPVVVPKSGDIVLLTNKEILNLSPKGELNWHLPLKGYAKPAEDPTRDAVPGFLRN